jgi:hypothetical protein
MLHRTSVLSRSRSPILHSHGRQEQQCLRGGNRPRGEELRRFTPTMTIRTAGLVLLATLLALQAAGWRGRDAKSCMRGQSNAPHGSSDDEFVERFARCSALPSRRLARARTARRSAPNRVRFDGITLWLRPLRAGVSAQGARPPPLTSPSPPPRCEQPRSACPCQCQSHLGVVHCINGMQHVPYALQSTAIATATSATASRAAATQVTMGFSAVN